MRLLCARCWTPITRGTAITEKDRPEVMHPNCFNQLRHIVKRELIVRGR